LNEDIAGGGGGGGAGVGIKSPNGIKDKEQKINFEYLMNIVND
jgi:hypothetical protein